MDRVYTGTFSIRVSGPSASAGTVTAIAAPMARKGLAEGRTGDSLHDLAPGFVLLMRGHRDTMARLVPDRTRCRRPRESALTAQEAGGRAALPKLRHDILGFPKLVGTRIGQLVGRWIPSRFIRASSVVGLSPRISAAPFLPLTFQPTDSSTLVM